MGIFDKAKDLAGDNLEKIEDAVEGAVDKVGDMVGDKIPGGDKVMDAVGDMVDKIDGEEG